MNDDDQNSLLPYIAVLVIFFIILAVSVIFDFGARDPQTFEKLMIQEGILEARQEGMPLVGCSDSDSSALSVKFSGRKNGVPVKGIVCGGYLKAYTIRYEVTR